jgi:hypothetical protein
MWLQIGFGRRRRGGIVVGDGHRLNDGDVAWVAGPRAPSGLLMGLLYPHSLERKMDGKDEGWRDIGVVVKETTRRR